MFEEQFVTIVVFFFMVGVKVENRYWKMILLS